MGSRLPARAPPATPLRRGRLEQSFTRGGEFPITQQLAPLAIRLLVCPGTLRQSIAPMVAILFRVGKASTGEMAERSTDQ
jgi:hypothetical protein